MHPTKVGPYNIERKIGAGGMGTVYLGIHAENNTEAAVKVLPASLAREDGFVARFEREIEALKQLANPHIVKFLESGCDNETYYYAMEYVDGETLTQFLRREKRIGWKEVIHVTLQICTALKAAHIAGIVHRDLKPSNLLLSKDGPVKLTDFGVAQVFAGTKLTATGGIVGTAEYMSPEQAQGQRATKKSDLYSLGAVMYVMLTGRPPFSGKTTVEVIQKHRYGQFDRPRMMVPEIPHWLDEIVCQLLEKEPDKRFADAYVLSRRLDEVLKKVELSARTDPSKSYDANAPTVAASAGIASGPGEGTIIRDLVRAEIDAAGQRSFLGHLLDSTWVLVTLLVLLVTVTVAWLVQPGTVSPDDEIEISFDGNTGSNSEWLRNTRRYRRHTAPTNDAQSFLHLALHYRDMRDTVLAERKLEALYSLLADQPQHSQIAEWTKQLLAEVRAEQQNQAEKESLLKTSLERASQLTADGKLHRAREIWSSIIELYGQDPSASEEVDQARKRLGEKVSSTSSPQSEN